MEHRSIGTLSVSKVGLGCNNFGMRIDAAATQDVVEAAVDEGITLFDTADIYGAGRSEEFLGAALGAIGCRDDVLVATKFGAPGSAPEGFSASQPEWIHQACDASLKRLGIDHIDLYQQHMPDAEIDVAETLGALTELVDAGKVLEIGCSNYTSKMLIEADDVAGAQSTSRFASVQNRYSILHRIPDRNVTRICSERGLGLLPYFPLESGLLTGKYTREDPLPPGTRLASMDDDRRSQFLVDDALDKVEHLREHAQSRGASLLELAMSWLASNPVVASVIAGATKPDQVRANVAAAQWELEEQDRAAVDAIAPVPGM